MNKEHNSISGTKDEEKLKQVMLKTKKNEEKWKKAKKNLNE